MKEVGIGSLHTRTRMQTFRDEERGHHMSSILLSFLQAGLVQDAAAVAGVETVEEGEGS